METKAGGNAVGKRTVAVSRDDLQLVATRDEMVVLRAGMKAGVVARTMGIVPILLISASLLRFHGPAWIGRPKSVLPRGPHPFIMEAPEDSKSVA